MSKPKPRLLEEIKADRPPSGRTPLLIQVAHKLEPEDRKDLWAVLGDPTVTSSAISRALKKRGHNISAGAIAQFRRGEIVHEFA